MKNCMMFAGSCYQYARRTFLLLFAAMVLFMGHSTVYAQSEDAMQITPLQAQGSNEGGWNLRIKGIAAQADYTVLQVGISFANQRRSSGVQLANGETFLLTDGGVRLLLKRPTDDIRMQIENNSSMDGQLIFLGAIPVGTKALTLVINEGNTVDDPRGPSLQVPFELPVALQSQLKVHQVGDSSTLDMATDMSYPVQASNEGGLTVQVKSVSSEEDYTRLNVSVSFSALRRSNGIELAGGETFLRTATGDRLMLQRPADNPKLPIANNDTLVGELIFLGTLPADVQGLELVINDGHLASDTRASGLIMPLPNP